MLAIVFVGSPLFAPMGALAQGVDAARLRTDLEWIASPDRAGRAAGSPGAKEVREYIAHAFEDAGCDPGAAGAWYQTVAENTIAEHPEIHLAAGTSWQNIDLANVVALLPGSMRESGDPNPTALVIGAHYDHLGRDGEDIYAGADDNASGVAVLLEAARELAKSGPFRNDILFVAFDGEEAQTMGSAYYCEHPVVPLEQTLAMICLDTVGRMQERRLYALASGSAVEFGDILRGVNLGFGFDLATPAAGPFASDHLPFIEHGVPALHLSTGANPDYHRTGDTADKIQWETLGETASFVVELAAFLADRETALSFVPPGAEKVAAPAEGGQPRRVSLGTIPDFGKESGGVLLTGVMPGSPAEKAGLQKGDVVVSLDETPIDNLADLSNVLKAHQPGDEVLVVVLRDGAKVEQKVTLVERSSH
ncbi:MAG: M20/M25/M40 family metallo-hydrolase [Candidatus Eisenbacteria bacterium]|uniref:M20/M25/M40 family metallo-hydrolase n=1 Tax=Eiseniibacteriota bacterium TaxID=2212470 RepID=A0A956LXM2_UNCEI|nr:M20/M25/M40 family metallo-hydrolase [Candidatus Eisenbacteria bacterium]